MCDEMQACLTWLMTSFIQATTWLKWPQIRWRLNLIRFFLFIYSSLELASKMKHNTGDLRLVCTTVCVTSSHLCCKVTPSSRSPRTFCFYWMSAAGCETAASLPMRPYRRRHHHAHFDLNVRETCWLYLTQHTSLCLHLEQYISKWDKMLLFCRWRCHSGTAEVEFGLWLYAVFRGVGNVKLTC